MPKLKSVPEKINFAEEETRTLEKWRREDTFRKSVELSRDRPHYTFYDGPPFATGLPHYGHILAGNIKDTVTRWAHQKGHYVERRFGWDTHGLPVEHQIDKELQKELGIQGAQAVAEIGIAAYNEKCRSIVMRYAKEWKITVERCGRWIDFENDYKTLYHWFMESVWWVFAQIYKKGLVYQGIKVMPYSTGCCTPVANFEAGLNYKDTDDPAIFVAFELVDTPNRFLVAWTTTPWTLPSNLALCVHPTLDYAAVKDNATGREYVLLESRLGELYKKPDLYTAIETFKGEALSGKDYKPILPYFSHLKEQGRKVFRVLTNTFVTTEQGTGVVHQAPYFGEVDFQCCMENGVIVKTEIHSKDDMLKIECPVDDFGRFTAQVPDYTGVYVKDADKPIIKRLKEQGSLVRHDNIKHSYPFCWRSDTPLLYKAVPAWFIRVEEVKDRLLANNEQTHWVPSNVKEKRFGNWLKDARDWVVSRNRFWGTPINLWASDDFSEIFCPESIAELEEASGVKLTDLHRENIDPITVPSKTGKGTLHRVNEVFDCWFESGSMPYASRHYPFENAEVFQKNFPADFIAEGIDQTRGWFYTLLVISTILFDRPAWKNLVCNGLVLASDGNKMSKKLRNYPDPMLIIDKFGADALRLYLINSPVVRGENLKFREEGVASVLKDVLLPWFNGYRFFVQSVQIYEHNTSNTFSFRESGFTNVMDKWVLSYTNSLIGFVHKEMDAYRLYAVVGPLTKYFDTLNNVYIRLNRRRLKGDDGDGEDDQLCAISALGHVLVLITRLMCPFTPFFCEYLWENLKNSVGRSEDSVHFTMLPTPEERFIDKVVERRVAAMRTVIEIGRLLRDKKSLPVKYPLKEMVVINRSAEFLADVKSLEYYILSELNVEQLTVSEDKHKYGVQLKAEPNLRELGARLRGDRRSVVDYLQNEATEAELEQLLNTGKLTVKGYELSYPEEVSISFAFDPAKQSSKDKWETEAGSACVVMLNTAADPELEGKGVAREVLSQIQKLRKAAKLHPNDLATAHCVLEPEDSAAAQAVAKHLGMIEKTTGTSVKLSALPKGVTAAAESEATVKDAQVKIQLVVPS